MAADRRRWSSKGKSPTSHRTRKESVRLETGFWWWLRPTVSETSNANIRSVWVLRYDLAYLMKRPKKSLHPFVLVIHDCLLRARSLCSVNPIVRLTRGGFVEVVSASLMAASVCSFLIAAASAFCLVLAPNSVCLRLSFMYGSP